MAWTEFVAAIQKEATVFDASADVESRKAVRTGKKEDMEYARQWVIRSDDRKAFADAIINMARRHWPKQDELLSVKAATKD